MSGGRRTWRLALIAILGGACAPLGADHDGCSGLANCDHVDLWEVGASDTDVVETVFELSHAARPATLQVSIDDLDVPASAEDGYTYEYAPHTITLHGAWVPEPGALLKATYQIAAVP